MANVTQLPTDAKRLFRPSTLVNIDGIATPGQVATATETWFCGMGNRGNFLDTVLGVVEVVGGYGGVVARRVPLRHPEYPFLLATGCRSRGRGWDGTLTSSTHPNGFWAYAEIEVNFATRNYDLSGQGAFTSISGAPSTRPIPGSPAGFRINGIAPPFDVDDEVQGEEITFVMHQLATLPLGVFDSVRSCVNAGTFVVAGIPRDAGTVLYRGPSYSATANFTTGASTWELSHVFSYSKVPWNYYYFPDGTTYEMTRADGTKKYHEADLTLVFGF